MSESATKFDEWALVEVMGRQRIVGKVTEATLAGGAFLRVDVVDPDTKAVRFTRFYAPGSIYCISPIGEAEAMQLSRNIVADPVSRWELPSLAAKVSDPDSESEYDNDDCPL